MAVMVVVVVIL